ncbi:MAG: PDDEXK nuclease domain-containing protein [Candidatus Riflebacteria bacterium]|nr:PDDEXK nuclease domain-containing protein [Candidatus Riflebacteria bacterium]
MSQQDDSRLLFALSEMMTHLQLARESAGLIAGALIDQQARKHLDFVDLPIPLDEQCLSQIRFVISRKIESLFLSFNADVFLVARNPPFFSDMVFFSRSLRCLLLVDVLINELQQHDFERANEKIDYAHKELTRIGENPPIALLISVSEKERKARYILKNLPTIMYEKQYISAFPPIGYIEDELEKWLDELKKPVWKRWNINGARRMVDLDYEILMEGLRRVFRNYPSTGKKAIFFDNSSILE